MHEIAGRADGRGRGLGVGVARRHGCVGNDRCRNRGGDHGHRPRRNCGSLRGVTRRGEFGGVGFCVVLGVVLVGSDRSVRLCRDVGLDRCSVRCRYCSRGGRHSRLAPGRRPVLYSRPLADRWSQVRRSELCRQPWAQRHPSGQVRPWRQTDPVGADGSAQARPTVRRPSRVQGRATVACRPRVRCGPVRAGGRGGPAVPGEAAGSSWPRRGPGRTAAPAPLPARRTARRGVGRFDC